MRIYVAGPIILGDQIRNIRNAIDAAEDLLRMGHTPFVPHLFRFWHLLSPHDPGEWLSLDRVWLGQCEALLRIPGESVGADLEIQWANELGMPVYYSVQEIPSRRSA